MRKYLVGLLVFFVVFLASHAGVLAQTPSPDPASNTPPIFTPQILEDSTSKVQAGFTKPEVTFNSLDSVLAKQELGPVWPKNPLKYAIRNAVSAGVPANTIVLIILLPVIASIIAAARHIVGIRGFGIFLPAALSVVFMATGPIVGIGLFLVIVAISTLVRLILRKTKIKLQYLPRMALILWFVSLGVLGILFLAPTIQLLNLSSVSIFPVLIIALLAEDFTRVQLGKSARVAVSLTTETLILSFVSYLFLTLRPVREFALLNPEVILGGVFVFNLLLGRYTGLRFLEFWRFRKLIQG